MDLFRRKSNTGINASAHASHGPALSGSADLSDQTIHGENLSRDPLSDRSATSTPPAPHAPSLPPINLSPFSFQQSCETGGGADAPFTTAPGIATSTQQQTSSPSPISREQYGGTRSHSLSSKRSRTSFFDSFGPSSSARAATAAAAAASASVSGGVSPQPMVRSVSSPQGSLPVLSPHLQHAQRGDRNNGSPSLPGNPGKLEADEPQQYPSQPPHPPPLPSSSSSSFFLRKAASIDSALHLGGGRPSNRLKPSNFFPQGLLTPGGGGSRGAVAAPATVPLEQRYLAAQAATPSSSSSSSQSHRRLLRTSRVGQYKKTASSPTASTLSLAAIAAGRPAGEEDRGSDVEYESDSDELEREDVDESEEDAVQVIWKRVLSGEEDDDDEDDEDDSDDLEDDEEWITDPTTNTAAYTSDADSPAAYFPSASIPRTTSSYHRDPSPDRITGSGSGNGDLDTLPLAATPATASRSRSSSNSFLSSKGSRQASGAPETGNGALISSLASSERLELEGKEAKQSREPMSVAVVGNRGAGKTTLLKRAFRGWGLTESVLMGKPGATYERRSARPMLKNDSYHRVTTYELDLSILRLDNDIANGLSNGGGSIGWPEGLPSFEALILCYDAGDASSWAGCEEFYRFRDHSLPLLVFACKSAGVPRPVEISPADVLAKGWRFVECSAETEGKTPRIHQGFSFLLREAHNKRYGSYSPQPHAQSDPMAASSPSGTLPPSTSASAFTPMTTIFSSGSSTRLRSSSTSSFSHISKPSNSSSLFSPDSQQLLADEVLWQPDGGTSSVAALSPTDGAAAATISRMTEGDEKLAYKGKEWEKLLTSEQVKMTRRGSRSPDGESKPKIPRYGNGMGTLRDIVGSLFFNLVTNKDPSFAPTFFACYRRFARPCGVLALLKEEFIILDSKHLPGTFAQLKLCGGLSFWIKHYPNDFVGAPSQEILRSLFQMIGSRIPLAYHAGVLLPFHRELDRLVEERLSWAKSDNDDESSFPGSTVAPSPVESNGRPASLRTIPTEVFVQTTKTTTIESNPSSPALSSNPSTIGSRLASIHVDRGRSDSDASRRTTNSSEGGFSGSGPANSSGGTPSPQLSTEFTSPSLKSGSRGSGSAAGASISSNGLGGESGGSGGDPWTSKALERIYQRFMDTPIQVIAADITRLEWAYFEQIQARDLLTQTFSGGSDGDEDHILRQFSKHFNDLTSLFVLLVLSQPKIKARSAVYEKIVHVAHLLRQHNNYMALLSVISAMSEIPVDRLALTKESARDALERTDPKQFTRFLSQKLLVSPKGSYKHYKMAVREDERLQKATIPMVPAIFTELNAVKESFGRSNRAQIERGHFPEGLINWREYEKYGEVFGAVARYQLRGCPVVPSASANTIVEMLRLKPEVDEKALERRSQALEGKDDLNYSIFVGAFKKFTQRH